MPEDKPTPKKFQCIDSQRIKTNHENRPFIFVRVNDVLFNGLLDSGAQITVMSRKAYDKISHENKLQKIKLKLTTAGGSNHETDGYFYPDYSINGVQR